MSATPAFFMAELGELGFEILLTLPETVFVSTLEATWPLASLILAKEAAAERTSLLSCILRASLRRGIR